MDRPNFAVALNWRIGSSSLKADVKALERFLPGQATDVAGFQPALLPKSAPSPDVRSKLLTSRVKLGSPS